MKQLFILTLALLAGAAPATAQSLFATRGFGVPVDPVDARGRLLGVGTGLFGLNTSLVNPADLAGVPRRGLSATLQPVSGTTRFAGAEDSFHGTRFPVLTAVYPVIDRFVLSGGYGAVYDQSWAVVVEGTESPDGTETRTRDFIRATGGLAQARLGLAYSVTPRIAVGAGGGIYTGNVIRDATRFFPEAPTLEPFSTSAAWEYSGTFGTLGVRWDADPALRVAASATFGGELSGTNVAGGQDDVTFSMPNRYNFGASMLVAPTIMLAGGAERTVARGSANVEGAAEVRSTWRGGGGVEYTALRLRDRPLPVRIGGQWAQLPFHGAGEDPAREWSAGLGLGLRLAGDEFGPLAQIDTGFERGGRSGLQSIAFPDGLQETFWRMTFSVSVFGR
jgi:hypothetical protein